MADNDALTKVFERNAFYRRMHFLMLGAFLLTVSVIIFLSWSLFYLIRNPDEPLFFATDSVGKIITILSTDKPHMTNEQVIAWTTEAMEAALSYDFVNYRAQFQNVQKYFTEYGWQNFLQGLRSSNNLIALTERKQVVIAQVVPPVRVLTQGILAGSYAWKFEMRVLVTYFQPPFDKPAFSNPLVYTVIVQRQPILQSYRGLGILQVIGRFFKSPDESTGTNYINTCGMKNNFCWYKLFKMTQFFEQPHVNRKGIEWLTNNLKL